MKKERISNVNGDILSLMKTTDKIGWQGIRKISIYRVLYLASVLYSFRYPEKENPFSNDYTFVISLQGPYSDIIDNSLIYLETNNYIIDDRENEVFQIGENPMPNIEKLPSHDEKREWLKVVVYILGIYGEEKVYDFVFRDPEYQNKVQSNSIKEIDLRKGNKTYENLLKFKNAFEETIGDEVLKYGMDDKKYLELYFRYIFSKILKGEMN